MRYLIISVIFFLITTASNRIAAQQERLSAFDYVVVPDRFDFQYERDQYQINSLLKFLFNKHGFHAFFPSELPDVSRCDGLYAEIEQVNGFVWTEVSIRLLDCDGILFYQTKSGRSKLKDFAKAYSESIRMAFESIEILGVRQGPLEILQKGGQDSNSEETIAPDAKANPKSNSDRPLGSNSSEGLQTELKPLKNEAVTLGLIPDVAMMNFKSFEKTYLLRRTDLGYQWYREDGQDLIYEGKFFVVEKMLFYEDKDQMRYLAEFTPQGALILNREGQRVVFEKAN
ncbi:MAG TPA: hypothetical protein DHV98_08750 [Flavobacteriaceae bacterium]|jgi:hypothetical protein|nr:hypothetical protein [Flavobacteriaceae bacterium]